MNEITNYTYSHPVNDNLPAIILMFPGVGSHYKGMGKNFYDNFKIARETFMEASDVLNIDLAKMCFEPSGKEELNKLENAQFALLTVSTASFRVYIQEIGIKPTYCIGHSLGEYSALCCSGVIQFPDALHIVRQRGLIINETVSTIDGTMAWVINLDSKKVEEVCEEMSGEGKEVFVSAYDSPSQTSISGRTDALMIAAKKLEKAGAIVYPLKFSGPFHSPLMKPAAEKMKHVLGNYRFKSPQYTVIANQDVRPYTTARDVLDNLSLQLIRPIHWKFMLEYIEVQGGEIAVEIGPKSVLKFLTEKNTSSITAYSLNGINDIKAISDKLIIGREEFLSIIGRCLGLAASCKNRNHNNDQYREYVVKPYMKIEAVYQKFESNGNSPGLEHVQEAVQMLKSVLNTKRVPVHEQEKRFDRLWRGRVLSRSSEDNNK